VRKTLAASVSVDMKTKHIIILGLICIIIFIGLYSKKKYFDPRLHPDSSTTVVKKLADNNNIKNGDIIFQTSLSAQSKAIQLATKSKYSHCGLIYKVGSDYFVFEAIQPVKRTPLDKWIARGQDGKYVIKRLKNADSILTESTLKKMKEIADEFDGKNYDLTFEWSDDRIYCSELIWKIYKRGAGIELGKLQKLREFDLSNESVKIKMKERYGENIPSEELVISPASIFESDNLMTVKAN